MSFNLNKNEGPVPSKKGSFDLSKTGNQSTGADERPAAPGDPGNQSKRKYWLILLVIVAAGIGAWFFTGRADAPQDNADQIAAGDSSSRAASDQEDTLAADTATMPLSNMKQAPDGREPGTVQPAAEAQAAAIKGDAAPEKQAAPAAPANSAPGSAVIAASFKAGSAAPGGNISRVLAAIRKKLKTNSRLKISVFGYASSEGPVSVNQTISQARAEAYKRLLVTKGIKDTDVDAQGMGTANPVAPNDTESGRRKNRRVEVSF